MNNKQDVTQLYREVVQYRHYHRNPSIPIARNRVNKDPQRNYISSEQQMNNTR